MALGPWVVPLVVGLVLLVSYAIAQFNRMVQLRNRITESWANVDTELQRRHQLIPNLVRTVQGYARHEKEVLEEIVRLRTAASRHQGGAHRTGKIEGALTGAIDRLLLVAERYPDLKASTNFLQLQEELAVTEDRIQAARRFYNGNVRDYHNRILTFPGNVFAGLFGFREGQYFQVEHLHYRQAPRVLVRA